jgi:hypothetical protein
VAAAINALSSEMHIETIEQPGVALGNRRLVSGSFNATMASVLVTIRDIMCLRGFETFNFTPN